MASLALPPNASSIQKPQLSDLGQPHPGLEAEEVRKKASEEANLGHKTHAPKIQPLATCGPLA